jgi:hypothetical protein
VTFWHVSKMVIFWSWWGLIIDKLEMSWTAKTDKVSKWSILMKNMAILSVMPSGGVWVQPIFSDQWLKVLFIAELSLKLWDILESINFRNLISNEFRIDVTP